jgi:hypothetical protein
VLHIGGPTARRADGDLGVEDVFAAWCISARTAAAAAEVTAGKVEGVLTTWCRRRYEVSFVVDANVKQQAQWAKCSRRCEAVSLRGAVIRQVPEGLQLGCVGAQGPISVREFLQTDCGQASG